jgi:hypothetical protein
MTALQGIAIHRSRQTSGRIAMPGRLEMWPSLPPPPPIVAKRLRCDAIAAQPMNLSSDCHDQQANGPWMAL